jgi:hypothetical protein
MERWLRWLVVSSATGIAFVLLLWAAHEIFGTLSWSASDKLTIEVAFATVMATSILTAGAWYAAQNITRDNGQILSEDSPPSEHIPLTLLAEIVKKDNQALLRSLVGSGILPVTWCHERPAAVDIEGSVATGNNGVAQLVRLFKRLRQQQLIVIGDPGSGKTTMTTRVLLELIAERQEASDPVPIRFSLSSWNPRNESLRSWMMKTLIEEHSEIARILSRSGRDGESITIEEGIVPVLDGLDELDGVSQRNAAIEALRKEMGADRPLILILRTKEFYELRYSPHLFPGATVVRMQPLSMSQVRNHFAHTSPRGQRTFWKNVFEDSAASRYSSFRKTLTNPLMVWLASVTFSSAPYNDSALMDLLNNMDGEAIEAYLLEALVPAAFEGSVRHADGRTEPLAATDPEEAQRWLMFLAGQLKNRNLKDIRWWKIGELVPQRRLALPAVMIFGLLIGTASGASVIPTLWFSLSVFWGCIFGFGVGHGYSRARSRNVSLRGRIAFGGRIANSDADAGTLLRRVYFGSCASLILAVSSLSVIVGAAWGADEDPRVPLAMKAGLGAIVLLSFISTAGCLLGGEAIGLISGLVMQSSDALDKRLAGARASSPTESARKDGYAALRTCIAGAVVAGAFSYIALRSATDHPLALTVGSGVLAGVCSSLVFTPWPRFRTAGAWLAITGKLPWKLMSFLDEACEHGVLRQVGITFEFRHELLQNSLAARNALSEKPLGSSRRTDLVG